jgi:hypothetical protein
MEQACPTTNWPLRLKQSYAAEKNLAAHRRESLFWELELLSLILADIGVRPVLLKGAAYLASGFDFAKYRSFGDIDILVPYPALREVEKRLMINGWVTTKTDAYDQHYYRTWMHELPPMQHMHRGTTLDVHHRILPLTARYHPNPALLFSRVRPAGEMPSVDVLCAEDMFLHAAVHLFSEGEDENAFRNLLDLHDLLLTGLEQTDYWLEKLIDRSIELDLLAPLTLAGRYLERVLKQREAALLNRQLSERGVVSKSIAIWDAIYEPVFLGLDPSISGTRKRLARQILLIRGHFLRMPLMLLLPHLVRKAFRPKKNKPK